jgi:hypothetical protein
LAIYHFIKTAKENSKNESQIAQLLAADSFLNVLKKVTGKDNLAELKEDLDTADKVSQANLNSFGVSFGYQINGIFINSESNVDSRDPAISYPHRKERAKMCFLLASMPRWPNTIWHQFCNGMKLVDPDAGIESVVFSPALLKEGYAKRRCLYRNFQRKSQIYQQWDIKL